MNVTDAGREALLETYGRWYGEERFAVAFTATLNGDNAKRVTAQGWDKAAPLTTPDYAAGLIAERGKTRNVAIVLRPSNLIVLECDTEDDLLRIQSLDLPETITVRSSKPYKRHFYFRPAETLTALPYVAFRFESGKLTADSGRYFLAPPSIHPSGAVYAFLPGHGPGDMDIAELPEHIYRMLTNSARAETSELRERIHVDPKAKVHAGNRADSIFRLACMFRRWGMSRDSILEQALRWNDERCEPPIERARVEMQVDGAMKKRGDQEIARAIANPIPDDEPREQEETRDSWTPINLAELDERPPIKPTLGKGGIAYPGKRHIFSGPQESAKTLAAYAVALELVREDHHVVVVDFEMGQYEARDRLRDLGATPDDFSRIHYIEPDQPATTERVQTLVQLRPMLVIIDAAAGAYDNEGLDDNKRQDVEKFTRIYVRDFWRAGIATIVLDHVVKNSETRGKYAIGSERKVGGADVHLGFDAITPIKRGDKGAYKITTHKDRGGYLQRGRLADLHLVSDPITHRITWSFVPADHPQEGEVWRPTILMERVSQYLQTQPDAVSFNAVITNTKGKDSTLKEALEHLISLGYVREEEGDRGARNVALVKPYTPPLPTSAPPLPAEVESDLCPPLPTSAPPYRGQSVAEEEVDAPQTTPPLPIAYNPNDPDVRALLEDDQ